MHGSFQPAEPGAATQPCWHCTGYDGLGAGGTAALCKRPGVSRLRAMPGRGCVSFERQIGADDEPDRVPDGHRAPAVQGGPWTAAERPPAPTPVRWAP